MRAKMVLSGAQSVPVQDPAGNLVWCGCGVADRYSGQVKEG